MVLVRGDWLTGLPYLGLVLASIFRQNPGDIERTFPFLSRLIPKGGSSGEWFPYSASAGGKPVTADQSFYGPLTMLARGVQEAHYSRKTGHPPFHLPGYEEDDAIAFASLRHIFGVNEEDYVASMSRAPFFSFQTNSKSNQYFCFTGDGRYIIKTMSSEEIVALKNVLLDYHRHIEHYPHSLLVQYCGHYRVGSYHFLVMRNLLHTPPHSPPFFERYDVKGSTVGRSCAEEDFLKPGKVMKDMELVRRPMGLEFGHAKPAFLRQLVADVAFLETHNLMDYSLLIGIKPAPHPGVAFSHSLYHGITNLMLGPSPHPPPQNGWSVRSAHAHEVYVVGIIDILQLYNTRKWAEVTFKSMVYDYRGVSAANPTFYANRFLWFLTRVVRGNQGEDEHVILNLPSWFKSWFHWPFSSRHAQPPPSPPSLQSTSAAAAAATPFPYSGIDGSGSSSGCGYHYPPPGYYPGGGAAGA